MLIAFSRPLRQGRSLLAALSSRTALAVALVAVAQAASGQAPQGDPPPNVVIFLADDLGWADTGFRGSDIDTPNLDRLAKEGVELSRFYTTPICTPTRAALMTGRDPVRMGLVYSVIMPWDNHGLHPDEHLMPESLRAAGYQTAIIGKWHLGHAQQPFHPNSRGFEHFYGHLHTEVGYYPPFRNQGGKDMQRNGVSLDDEGYETDLLADEAIRWLAARDAKRPFFLYMPFIAPHTPLDAPEALRAKYADMPDHRAPARSPLDRQSRMARLMGAKSLRPMYAAVVEGMDRAIGRVLDALDEHGLSENTIVLFFSDNGGQVVYSAGGADNAPLRGGKGETFEGGIRVVSLLRAPGRLPAGERVDTLMTVMDVFPTLAAAVGISPQGDKELDGLNLWPSLSAGRESPRDDDDYVVLASEIPIYDSYKFTAFNDQWKLVEIVEREFMSSEVTRLLFRIDKDPHEENNLADVHPRQVRRMAAVLRRWRALHPVNGVRARLMPPPGWRAPRDWADYTIATQELQDSLAPGMAPASALRPLDFMHGERGRLIYDCEPWPLLGGGLCR